MRTVISNGSVLDTPTMEVIGQRDVVIEDDVIVDVVENYHGKADQSIDAGGQFVVPGLIDGHVHFRLATMDFRRLAAMSEVEYGVRMAELAKATVERGFTTVRDLGGDVSGLIQAIQCGVADGPRIIRAGRMLTQTGGHGDVEGGPREAPSCACSMRSTTFGIVADGPEAVRKAARHNLREGSDFLKVHVSGGVATPSDPLESIQYTHEELQIAVVEAAHRHTYVSAHAYSPESISLAIGAGVHTI
ncbi:MAG: amidohydrolase family protein, partial [Acidimicrobiaceae bacterium]|nr:amidohydrolase family protein [Acidimicrobiaceae bacterium]